MDVKLKMKEYIKLVDENLDKLLPQESIYPETIHKAMRYSVFAGGKRLRPILAIATCEALGGTIEEVIPFACAIEMIHTYSLIHDDLPAMDNDDYRRGKLTNHKVFGEAMAILAGDALLNTAPEIMSKVILAQKDSHKKYIKAMYEIMYASGTNGMISGQVVDLESENKPIDENILNFMHNHKTGALITAPIRVGAIIAGANETQLERLTDFSKNLGLAFQIRDDILDIIGDEAKLGKKVGSDQNNNKSTFPSVYGLEKSQEMVKEISKKAIDALEFLGGKGEFLRELTDYLVSREH